MVDSYFAPAEQEPYPPMPSSPSLLRAGSAPLTWTGSSTRWPQSQTHVAAGDADTGWSGCSPPGSRPRSREPGPFVATGESVAATDHQLLTALGLTGHRPPSESTIRRAFTAVAAEVLDDVLGVWMWTRARVVEGRRVIAIDGKTLRGARGRRTTAPHLVAALDHATGAVLGQIAVAAKSNQIPTVRDLLAGFDTADLHGCVITADAMHTCADTAQVILDAGADYLFTVKKNPPKLLAKLKTLPRTSPPTGPPRPVMTAEPPAPSRSPAHRPGSSSPAPRRWPRSGAA